MIEIRCRISTPLAGSSGTPATTADPDVGVINVASKRTVVVLPAPFGPRKPNTSPAARLNDTSETANRSPNCLLSLSPTSTALAGGPAAVKPGSAGSLLPSDGVSATPSPRFPAAGFTTDPEWGF